MQSQINRITDILRRDDGISGAMHYTEQISWILFLKFLDDYEKWEATTSSLKWHQYISIIDDEFKRWSRAVIRKPDDSIDTINNMSWDDLKEFVNKQLFPYLKSFRHPDADFNTMAYKIGEIFYFLENRIESGHTLREILDIVDGLNFQSSEDLFELSKVYEDLLQGMGNDGWNSGEFYTPRAVIISMVQCLDPQVWQTIYDGAVWSWWFLIEAYNHMKDQPKNADQLHFLQHDTFYGNEKTPIAYIMGVMNMILHGITNPHINKKNTLTDDVRNFQESDRFDIILANPPFGGKEKDQIQINFPIKTNATEMLFMQHFMKKLKTWGKAAIVVPEWVLFNTWNAFQKIKSDLLERFNLHTIVSLPAWIFLPYSGVKTNIIFFDKTSPTKEIRYYEVDPGRKLTKNKPITADDMQSMIDAFTHRKTTEQSWIVNVDDIKDGDISAKNPAKIKEIVHRTPKDILQDIHKNHEKISKQLVDLSKML